MELKQVPPVSILGHIGYTGGRSRNRKNTNYKEVGLKILSRGETPPFEHYNVTFDLDGTSRYLLYLLSTSRVITITANSQRYLKVENVLDYYNNDPFVSGCLASYLLACGDNVKKEEARALLPLASKTADLSFTTNIRELNRLYCFFEAQKNTESSELAALLKKYLTCNDVFFSEPLPSGFYPQLTILPRLKESSPEVGTLKVTHIKTSNFMHQFVLRIPFYIWMQLIRHKSLLVEEVSILNLYDPIVFKYLDPTMFSTKNSEDPYHILNGQYVEVSIWGPLHAWENFLRWRLEKATQPATQKLAQAIAKELHK